MEYSGMRRMVAFAPNEEARLDGLRDIPDDATVFAVPPSLDKKYSPESRGELLNAIRAQNNPMKRAALEDAYRQNFGEPSGASEVTSAAPAFDLGSLYKAGGISQQARAATKSAVGFQYDLNALSKAGIGDVATAEKPAPSGFVGRLKDTGIDLAKGVVSTGESLVGLGSIATGGLVGKGMAAIGYDPKQTQEWLAGFQSDARQQEEQDIQAADGFWDTLTAIGVRPGALVGRIVQSIPGTVGAGAVGGAVARRIAATAAAEAKAAGMVGDLAAEHIAQRVAEQTGKILLAASGAEGAQSAGSIAEAGRQAGREWSQYAAPAVAGGIGTAAIGRASMALGNKLGIGDIEADIAMRGIGGGFGKSAMGMAKRVPVEAFKEGVLEEMPQSTQEKAFENIATGRPWDEHLGKAAAEGLIAGAGMGGGHALISGRRPDVPVGETFAGRPISGYTTEQLFSLTTSPAVSDAAKAKLEAELLRRESADTYQPSNVDIQFQPGTTGTPESSAAMAEQIAANNARRQEQIDTIGFEEQQAEQNRQRQAIIDATPETQRFIPANRLLPAPSGVDFISGQQGTGTPAQWQNAGLDQRATERQQTIANGVLAHHSRPSPDLLQRLMRVDQTMATMLFNHWKANGLQNQGQEAAQEVSSKFDPQGLQPGTPEYAAAFDSWAAGQQESKRRASLEQRRVEGQAAVDKKNGWRKRLVSWFETAKDGDTITTDIEGEEYLVVEKTIKRNGKEIVSKRLVLVGNDVSNDQTIIEYRDGKAYTGPNTSQGIDESAGWAQLPETDIDSRAASLGKLLEEGIAKVGAGGTALDAAAHQAATSPLNDLPHPTDAQKEAGNYTKGHLKLHGLDITIENPAGSVRSGKDEDGKAWENTLQHHYGYIKGTIGRDKDHLDVFIKPGAQSARTAYVVDQINPKTGKFDEHKIVLGADSEADARAIYHANYEQGWQGMGAITAMPIEQFKDWIKSGKTKKPVAYTEPKGVSHEKPVPKAKAPAAIDPSAPYGKVGVAPFSSQVVGLKDNGDGTATVMRGEEPFYDFENGDPVTVPTGATAELIRKAVTDAGALSSRDKWFGVAKVGTKPAEAGTEPAKSGTEPTKLPEQDPAAGADFLASNRAEFRHEGFRIYPISIKGEPRWAVQSLDNSERENKGERQIGGDAIVDTPEQAKQQAESQVTERGQKAERQRQFAEQDAAEEAKKEANRGLSITERRANAALDKPTNLPVNAGVGRGSRREAMESAVSQGRAIVAADVPDTAAYKRDEDEQGRLHRAGYGAFFGNDSHPQKMRFNELTAKLKNRDNYQKKEYRLYSGRDTDGGFYEITKTEYDYAKSLMTDSSNAKHVAAIAGKPVADMPVEQLQKIASGESKTFGSAAVEKASAELARRDEADSPKATKEPWQYGELEYGDKYIDEVVLPDLRKQLANAHGGKFQEYPSKAAAVRGLKERIDTLENHRDAKARKYYASLDNHYGAVRAALADGKPVPPVAYESYDDLKGDVSAGRIKGDGQEVARVETPQHIESGRAEPATAPVIAASIKESAKNTPMNIEQAREWLLSEIDKAIIDAKSAKEEGIWNRADDKVNLEGIMDVGATIGFKTFDVPGDGKFRVLNLKESLQKFKKQVAASPGFKKNATRPMSLASGNGGKTSVRDLLDDGEYVLAADYGHLTGDPLLFGAAIGRNDHPVAYTNAEPVDIKGVDAQVGREWNQTGKSFLWRVIETTTGAMISSGTTKERAISKVLAKLDEHGVKKLIDIIKETPKVSQAELERQFTDWGSEEEAKAQKTRDAVERADAEDRALWNSIWPLDDGEKRSPNPWNDINSVQVVVLAKDAAKAGKGDEFVSLIERRRGGTNNILALAARKALADAAPKAKPAKGTIATGVASKILGDIYQRAAYNKWTWDRLKSYLTREMEEAGVGKSRMANALEKAMTEYARTANGRLGYPNSNLVFSAMRDYGLIAEDAAAQAKAEPAKGYPFYSNNKLFNAEGTAELPKDWTGVARSDSGKRFFYLGQENGERSFNPLKAENYEDALKEAEGLKNDKPVIPEGYREVARSYFGGTVEKPIYAPFAEGDRVRFIGGHAGNIQSFIGGPVTTGAIIKYDNGLTGRAEWRDVEAVKKPSAEQEPKNFKSIDTLNAANNPLGEDDWIRFADGSEWQVKGRMNGWALVQGKTEHPTVKNIMGQVPLIRAVVDANDAAQATKGAEDTTLTVKYGGSELDIDLGNPAYQATMDDVEAAVRAKGYSADTNPRTKYDPMQMWRNAHATAVAKAAKDGKPIPARVLYDYRGLIRDDLNDEQADIAADKMVEVFRDTKDYEKAVQAYRDFGRSSETAPTASIAGKPVSEMSDGMLNQIAKSSQPAAEKAKAEVAKRKKPKADPLAAPEAGKPAATKEPVADRIDAAKRRLRAADTDEKRAEIEREIRALRQEAIADIQPGAAPQEQSAERAPRISMEQRAEMVEQHGEAYARGFMAQRDGFSIEPASDIRSKADKEKFKDGWIAAADLATKEPAQGAEKVGAGDTARVYLDVPFRSKDAAKGWGAKFDPEKKLWYAERNSDGGINVSLTQYVPQPDAVVRNKPTIEAAALNKSAETGEQYAAVKHPTIDGGWMVGKVGAGETAPPASIAGKPVSEMSDGMLNQIAKSSQPAAEKAKTEINRRNAALREAKATSESGNQTTTYNVGDVVKLTKPGVNGRLNIAGTVTKILPDGRLEVRTQQDGYMTVAESELGHKPKVGADTTSSTNSLPITDEISTPAISDFGEKIGGAKKDIRAAHKDAMKAAEKVDISAEPLSKSWPAPDYQALIDAGSDPWVVAFMRSARDAIPRKPSKSWKLKGWVAQVELLRNVSNGLLNGLAVESAKKQLAELAEKSSDMRRMAGRIELYELVGHRQSLNGVSLNFHHYALYKGEKNVSLWTVEKEAAATAFSNWPHEIATGKTKGEVLSKFKALYDKTDLNPPAAKEQEFVIYVQDGKYYVGKKLGRNPAELAGPFVTVAEARAYRTDNADALAEKLAKFKEIPRTRRESNEPRVGEDMRNGQDVTPEMFMESFGFRGVEFGNWVEQKKRQKDLNEAFDALMDMAAIIGVPARALSLNGELGLAFGARGNGGVEPAAAHYESDKIVINLTKKAGAGSLGHEFFHALDNYFSRLRGKGGDFTTEALDVSLASRQAAYHSDGAIRKEMVEAFGAVMRAIRNTALKARSSKLDAKRSKSYWTTDREMAARAFESYLISKLQDQNASNDYLANIVDEETWKAAEALGFELDDSYPYPTAGEVPAIREAFDNFFRTVETKETDSGVAMFNAKSGSRGNPIDAAALEATIARVIAGSPSHFSRDTVVTAPLFSDLPAPILAKAKKEGYDANGRKPNGEKLTGATYDGKVYLVQENISSELEAEETLLHERIHQIVHGNAKDPDGIALRQSLGKLYTRAGAKSGIERMAKEAGIDITGPLAAFPNVAAANRTAFLAEEFLAHAEGQRAYEKLPAKIKRAIREFYGEFRDWLRGSRFVRIAEALGARLGDFTQADLAWTLKGIRQQEAGTGSKAIRFMTAWHGSPHDHDGFDSSKIGTGEGAQAYGWGHYFASVREVAEGYRIALTSNAAKKQFDVAAALAAAKWFKSGMVVDGTTYYSRMDLQDDIAKQNLSSMHMPDDVRQVFADKLSERNGRLYQVELAPTEDELLDWDKPLSEQSEKVKAALIKAYTNDHTPEAMARKYIEAEKGQTGEDVYREMQNKRFADDFGEGSAEQASKYLNSLGIAGIKYLDGSSRNRPLKEIKAEFLAELPEDADTSEVMELVGTGRFSPKNEALIKALADDDWLGFDYPAQAISAALGNSLSNYDASPALLKAVSDAKDGGTHNYVIFSDADVKITAKESRGTAQGGAASPSVKAIQDVVSRFKSEFKGAAALDIRVVGSASEIPARYRPSPYAEGVFHDDAGLIYLVAMNLKHANGQVNTGRVWQVLLHECVGHFGLAKMMGSRFGGILKEVMRAARAKSAVGEDIYEPGHPDYATIEAVRLRYPGASDKELAQEVLARMAETDPGRTLFGYVRAVVRQWLRDMARAAGITLDVTTAELNDLVAQASRYMRRGDGLAQGVDVDALGVADMAVGGMASKATGMESRAAPTAGQPKEPRTGMLDTILRKAGGELAAKITGPAYDKLTAFLGGKVPEGIKAGMVSDYGLDESYVDRRTGMQTEQQKAARQTKTFVEGLMELDRAQSRVAYQWLNNRGAEADRLMAQLPPESQQVLKDIKIQIAKLTIEAVRLGQLDAETAERNFLAYLHRSYAKYDLNTDDKTWKAERAKAIKILGDQYKGRGLKMDVDPDRIHSAPGWWQGEMKGKRVKVLKNEAGRFAFVADGTAIPSNLSGYKLEGVWEIRARKADNRITLWRDFTQDERTMMGELDEAKYAVARTLFMMNRDIEVGRFHEWVADEYAKTPEEADEEGLQMADASDSMMRAFTPDEWVTVPTSKIPGTGVFKYGALAGMVVPGPVWNDIRQISAGRFEPFGAAYASILRAWKLSKTALTPTTHVNNIMGNFVMADMHDVGARDAIAAVRLMVAAANGDKDAKAMLDRFEDSGATQGMFTTHELKKEVLEPLLQQLREEVGMADDEAAILKASAIMSLALHGQFGEAWAGAKAAAKQSTAGRVTGAVVTKAQDYYQAEDSVFRLAAFLKSIDEGKTDREAGKLARKAFLDYHINAPWINAMRGTAMPFIAFAYRAIPMLIETAAKKPWKIAKYMLVAGGLNALAYAMLGADADEDKERAYLPEEKAGRLWGIVPKLIRMPWNRESKLRDGKTTSDPVFLDVRRWIPVGDVVDYGQDKSALPLIPQPLMPGGPLIIAAEFLVNKSAFTGKELTKETDTWVEKAAKVGGHFYKGFAPNVPIPYSGTWAGTKIDNAVKGKEDPLGRAYPVPEAIASGFGLKLERYPVDTLQRNAVLDMKGKLRELSDEQRQAARDYGRQGMTKVELDEKVGEIVGKKNAAVEEYKAKERKAMGRTAP